MIVTMKKVLILGTQENKESLLQNLQEAGVVHIEPVTSEKMQHLHFKDELNLIEQALKALSVYKADGDSAAVTRPSIEVARETLRFQKERSELQEQETVYRQQLATVQPWGEFSSELLAELAHQGVAFRFWKCPITEMTKFENVMIPWQKKEGKSAFLITLSYGKEIKSPEKAEEVFIPRGANELKSEMAEIEEEMRAIDRELRALSLYVPQLEKEVKKLSDQIAFEQARVALLSQGEVFGLKGWVPRHKVEEIKKIGERIPIALEIEEASKDDTPPTLIENPRWIQSVLDIVKLYATPGYREWDTSLPLYFAFAIFFAMIVGDGGYGLVLLSIMLYFRGKLMKSEAGARVFRLMTTLSVGCILYGLLSGSWFSIPREVIEKSPLWFLSAMPTWLKFDTSDTNFMMTLAVYIGAVHLSLARLIQAARLWWSWSVLPELGWIVAIWGGIARIVWQNPEGLYILAAGAAIVFLFSSTSRNPLMRILDGALALLGVTQNFADILSYLRLFALGLASAMLATVFNKLGLDVHHAIPGFLGYVLMVLILFAGHTINLGLSIMGGFIHGLRLNFLEFYRYCFEGTGYDYKPFLKIEG